MALRAMMERPILIASMKPLILLLAFSASVHAATLPRQWQITNASLVEYFTRETRAVSERCLADITSGEQWRERAPGMRAQLAEMLSLSPLPPRTEL